MCFAALLIAVLTGQDWPYGQPTDIEHWVLWSRVPVLGEGVSPAHWEDAQDRGLTMRFDDPTDGAGGGLEGAGREIGTFIERRWSPAEFDLVAYVNPTCVSLSCRAVLSARQSLPSWRAWM